MGGKAAGRFYHVETHFEAFGGGGGALTVPRVWREVGEGNRAGGCGRRCREEKWALFTLDRN